MDFCQILEPKQKALRINLDNKIYGTIAEIGAGQEVARHFFQAGGAAGTIAKTMSAYDMVISDKIYGREKSGRYVCQERVEKMLEYEYGLVVDRLDEARGADTQFFAFADTVAAKSYSGLGDCHGWLGVRFQHSPKAAPSEILLHVRMLDQENIQQQEAVGILGINLIYACFNYANDPVKIVSTLMDNLTTRRIEIDMIRVNGEAFEGIDSRILSLELVKRKYTNMVLFDENGQVMAAKDSLYKKNLVVLRGSFRPPTHVNMDMLNCGKKLFLKELPKEEHDRLEVLPEISMSKLLERGEVDNKDFLARVDLLSTLKQKVLITNFDGYFSLNMALQPICKKKIVFVTGVYNLQEILDIEKYKSKPSGILGALGELFGHSTQLFVYPAQDDDDATKLKTIKDVPYDDSIKHIVTHLLENKLLEDVEDYNPEYSAIWSRTVLKMIQNGDDGWDKMVPSEVAKMVKEKGLFKS
jgi:hypothetical protein